MALSRINNIIGSPASNTAIYSPSANTIVVKTIGRESVNISSNAVSNTINTLINGQTRLVANTTTQLPLTVSTVGEAYGTANTAGNLYLPKGVKAQIQSSGDFGLVDDNAALINFDVFDSNSRASGVYIGAVSNNTASNSPAKLVFGRRTGTSTWAESGRFDINGRLGIGTQTPTYPLHVYGPPKFLNEGFSMASVDKDASSGTVTFAYADWAGGLADNMGGLIIVSLYLATNAITSAAATYIGLRLAPRGSGGTLTQIATSKGAGITTFSVGIGAGTDGVVVTCDATANLRCRIFAIAQGGVTTASY